MPITAEQLKPSLEYLDSYFSSHHRGHRLMMRDAGGSRYGRGGEPYKGFNDAIQYIRDAVLLTEEEYANLKIPEGFATPQLFISRATAFRNMADHHARAVEGLVKENGDTWYSELSHAHKICSEIRDAIDHALELGMIGIEEPSLNRLLRLLPRLPRAGRALAKDRRYAKRATLEVADEYDVQDLMGAFLQLEFDDVRPEEWCPSYAGTSTRTDFLLPKEEIVVEVKHATKGRDEKKIVPELTIDIARYKKHPQAKHLVCAIWNTDHHLVNPAALKSDLETSNAGFVSVVIME